MDLRGVAMVTRAGTVRAELTGGLADAAAGVPCTPATRFQICSISKQFAAAAVLLLAEAGPPSRPPRCAPHPARPGITAAPASCSSA